MGKCRNFQCEIQKKNHKSRNHFAFFIQCFHQVQGNQLGLVELGNDNLIQNSVMDSLHEYVDWDQCKQKTRERRVRDFKITMFL